MKINSITLSDLRRMNGKEGLILQGCGGETQEWVDGINEMLTDKGILLDNTKFENVSVFKSDGVTCILYPFEDVHLDIGKLAMWRLQSYTAFAGMWLSDYVDNRLGGFEPEQPDDTVNARNIGSNSICRRRCNVPLSAQPFVRNADSGYSSSGSIKEVSGIKACFRVTDEYITTPISFRVAYVSSNNQRELIKAYEIGVQIMQLCQQIKQGGMPNMNQGYGQPMNNGFYQPQQGFGGQQQAYGQNGFAASSDSATKTREQEHMEYFMKYSLWDCKFCGIPNSCTLTCHYCGKPVSDEKLLALARDYAKVKLKEENAAQQGNYAPMQQSVPQSWICPSCGAQNSGKFCESCGTPRQY